MTPVEFSKVKDFLSFEADAVMRAKSEDYSSPDDVLFHFKNVASQVGVSPLLVWYVFFHKHILAVAKYVHSGTVSSEPVGHRFVDLLNYVYLGYALFVEEGNTRDNQL